MNYSELKDNISYLHRSDITSGDVIVDTFIDLFEAHVNRTLRCVEMEANSTQTPTDQYIAFPTDFLELKSIRLNGSSKRLLEYRTPAQIDALGMTTGIPTYYTVRDGQFEIAPSGAGYSIDLFYFSKITPLSSTDTTNWLIESHPDYYLAGMLLQGYIYTRDDAGIAEYQGKIAAIESEIKRQDRLKRYGSGPLVTTVN